MQLSYLGLGLLFGAMSVFFSYFLYLTPFYYVIKLTRLLRKYECYKKKLRKEI